MTGEAKDDGGHAFPHNEKNDDGTHWQSYGGMFLRDWFAGQALVGRSTGENAGLMDNEIAARCYEIADAMLKARKP